MMITKTSVQWTAVLGLASSVAVGVSVTNWWNTDPESPYRNVNLLEANVVNMVASTFHPDRPSNLMEVKPTSTVLMHS